MAEADEANVHDDDATEATPAPRQPKTLAARRTFLRQALAITSGVALTEFLPAVLWNAAAQAQAPICPAFGDLKELTRIGEITRNGNNLQAVLRVVDGDRMVPMSLKESDSQKEHLRYYKGYNPADWTQSWPPESAPSKLGPPGPGPTLRCSIGDNVQITFLNQVDVGAYATSAFGGEKGSGTGCDGIKVPGNTNYYPATDKFPNCLHASSAANIHFHGTHVTPSTTGDNVLVNIWPSKTVMEKDVKEAFERIFQECETRHIPQKWEDLPLAWRIYQERLIREYDSTAQYTGTGANPNGRGLPEYLRLWPHDAEAIAQGLWPTYYVGSYPYCFKIPNYYEEAHHSVKTGAAPAGTPLPTDKTHEGLRMGQAPGTHWYHSHKHGSTAINMFNGLSGTLIIEDNSPTGYDGVLKAFYEKRGFKLDQVVLVFQQIVEDPNLLAPVPQKIPLLVNGQFTPCVKMRPGQVQLWRMVNATVSRPLAIQFNLCPKTTSVSERVPQFRQTAQDGVQYAFANYIKPDNGNNLVNLAPANRADLLVEAPAKEGIYVVGTVDAPYLFIQVSGEEMAMGFPTTESDFPPMPVFLNDIKADEIRLRRKLVYGWEAGRRSARRGSDGAAPQYTIDGKQFQDGIVNQVMLLDTAEEWTIYNETSVAHPFHIHVNPFQIVEIYDPNNVDPSKQHLKFDELPGRNFVWWDDFAIPTAKTDTDGAVILDACGKAQDPGFFRMRSRFVDFTGQYVQHCHILAHEDRGMMQLLEVVDYRTKVKHH